MLNFVCEPFIPVTIKFKIKNRKYIFCLFAFWINKFAFNFSIKIKKYKLIIYCINICSLVMGCCLCIVLNPLYKWIPNRFLLFYLKFKYQISYFTRNETKNEKNRILRFHNYIFTLNKICSFNIGRNRSRDKSISWSTLSKLELYFSQNVHFYYRTECDKEKENLDWKYLKKKMLNLINKVVQHINIVLT